MPSCRLRLYWDRCISEDTITLEGIVYTIQRGTRLDWYNYMNDIFEQWKNRGFTIQSIFYPSRSMFTVLISK